MRAFTNILSVLLEEPELPSSSRLLKNYFLGPNWHPIRHDFCQVRAADRAFSAAC